MNGVVWAGRMTDVIDLGGEAPASAWNVGTVLAFVSKLRTEQTVAATSTRQLWRSDYGGESAVEVLVTDANLAAAAGGEADVETRANAAVVILGNLVVAYETAASLFQKECAGS